DVTHRVRKTMYGLDADKSNIPAAAGDHYYATDTFIDYVWDGTYWRGGSSFIPRSVDVPDFAVGAFTTDGTWKVNGLDLSGIVPVGAIAVLLETEVSDDAANSLISIIKNAASNYDRITGSVYVANQTIRQKGVVGIDADRLLDYWGTNLVFVAINITV
ncbi:unnamed protein product, partial [marine sediment metagenome]